MSSSPTPGGMAVNALFPTYLFCRDLPGCEALNAELAALGYRVRDADPEGRSISNRGGWQSKGDFGRNPACRPLVGFIEETLREIKTFLGASDEVNFYVASCWMNINGVGSYNASHIHGNSYFSGVYYVRTPPGSGFIEFREPSHLREYYSFPFKEMNARNAFSQRFEPVPGRLFVFPGYVPHEVTENRAEEDRVSVAFNVGGR